MVVGGTPELPPIKREIWHPLHAIKYHYIENRFEELEQGQLRVWPNFETCQIPDDIEWVEDPFNNKTWKLYYHSLTWIYGLLWGYDNGLSSGRVLVDLVKSYCSHLVYHPQESDGMVWDDHAAADRLSVLSCIRLHQIAEEFDDIDLVLIDHLIEEHVRQMIRQWESGKWGASNHGAFHALSILNASNSTKDEGKSNQWAELGLEYLGQVMTNIIDYEDGISLEQSLEYHQLAIELVKSIPEVYFIEISDISKEEVLENLIETNNWITFGDRRLAAIGDTSTIARVTAENFPPPPVKYGCRLFTNAGMWVVKDEGVHTTFTFNPTRIAHGHFDSLSFTHSIGENVLFADSGGPYAYGNPLRFEYFVSEVSHNTVLFDEKASTEGGELVESHEVGDGIYSVTARSCKDSPCSHQRTLTVIGKEGVVVLDQFRGFERETKLCLLFHLGDEVEVIIDGDTCFLKNHEVEFTLNVEADFEYSIREFFGEDGGKLKSYRTNGLGSYYEGRCVVIEVEPGSEGDILTRIIRNVPGAPEFGIEDGLISIGLHVEDEIEWLSFPVAHLS